MRLYIIRHGKAERNSVSGRDADRRLSERGKRQAAWLGEALADESPGRILSSPAARAWETASIIGAALGVAPDREDELDLGSMPSQIADSLIPSLADGGPAAIVGHNPTLSDLTCLLAGGLTAAGALELRTGQAAIVEIDDPLHAIGRCELVGLLRMEKD